MQNKYLNFLLKEPLVVLKLVAIVLLILVSLLISKKARLQAQVLRDVRQARELVEQIPDLQQQIAKERQRLAKVDLQTLVKSQPENKDFILSGIFVNPNDSYAVINDKIYHQSDTIDGFNLYEINPDSVILLEKNTGRTIVLIL